MISFALFVILPCLKVANSDDPFPILVSLSSRTTAAIQDENTTMSCTFLVPKKCNETCQDARFLFQDPITRQLRDASLLYHHYTSLRTLKVGDDKIQIDTDLRILPVTTAVREKYFCTVKCLNSSIVSSGELKTVFLPRRSFPGISKTPGALRRGSSKDFCISRVLRGLKTENPLRTRRQNGDRSNPMYRH